MKIKNVYLSKFEVTVDKYLQNKFTAMQFVRTFNKLFYNESTRPIKNSDWELIHEMFGCIEFLSPKSILGNWITTFMMKNN